MTEPKTRVGTPEWRHSQNEDTRAVIWGLIGFLTMGAATLKGAPAWAVVMILGFTLAKVLEGRFDV